MRRVFGGGLSKPNSTFTVVTLLLFSVRGEMRCTLASKRLSGNASTRMLAACPYLMRPISLSGTLAFTCKPEANSTIEELVAPAVALAAVVGVT